MMGPSINTTDPVRANGGRAAQQVEARQKHTPGLNIVLRHVDTDHVDRHVATASEPKEGFTLWLHPTTKVRLGRDNDGGTALSQTDTNRFANHSRTDVIRGQPAAEAVSLQLYAEPPHPRQIAWGVG
jgi:hypothetical protein